MMPPATCAVVAVLAIVFAGCGEEGAGSTREVAETYVDAVRANDWEAACEVSVHERMSECVATLREVYSDPGTEVPTVKRTQAVVEEVDGRKLVHFEYVRIK